MTYKQLRDAIRTLLQSHAMIKQVRFSSPTDWLFDDEQPLFPLACYAINTGSFEPGYKNFVVSFWFIDKSGVDGEFEDEVVNDQIEIANDIVGLLKQSHLRPWQMDDDISFTVLSEKFEDYLSGVELNITLKIRNDYDTCVIPFNP